MERWASEVRIGSHSRLSSRHCQQACYGGGSMQSAHQTTKSRASWKLCSGDSETQETDYRRIGSRQTKRDESFTTLDIPRNGCKAATAVLQHLPGIGTTRLLVIPCNTEVLNGRMLVVTQSLSCINSAAPGTAAHQAPCPSLSLEFAQIHVYGKTIILSVSWEEKNMILKHLKHTHTNKAQCAQRPRIQWGSISTQDVVRIWFSWAWEAMVHCVELGFISSRDLPVSLTDKERTEV